MASLRHADSVLATEANIPNAGVHVAVACVTEAVIAVGESQTSTLHYGEGGHVDLKHRPHQSIKPAPCIMEKADRYI